MNADLKSLVPQHVMGSVDVVCANGSSLHLEQDWRVGLGWWLIDGKWRWRLSVSDAIRAAPRGLGHEVLLEAQRLAPMLRLYGSLGDSPGPALQRALEDLQNQVVMARALYRDDPRIVGHHLADQLVA
ncbi:MAG: hypothetical protein E6J14_11830 [Chloroflexi bacterium]|nr:MAG: hypothetical protein E6J14_11830 [Chloroflexota bacterium]